MSTNAATSLLCEKCGSVEIKTRYHDGENYWGDGRHCANGSAARPTAHVSGEHLHQTCGTCGFDWTEECVDAPDA